MCALEDFWITGYTDQMQTRDQDNVIKIHKYVFLDAIVIISLAVKGCIGKIVYAVGCLCVVNSDKYQLMQNKF